MASLSSSNGEKSEGIGIEAVELTLLTEAGDDGLGTREAQVGVLVGQLRDQTAKACRAWEVRALGV